MTYNRYYIVAGIILLAAFSYFIFNSSNDETIATPTATTPVTATTTDHDDCCAKQNKKLEEFVRRVNVSSRRLRESVARLENQAREYHAWIQEDRFRNEEHRLSSKKRHHHLCVNLERILQKMRPGETPRIPNLSLNATKKEVEAALVTFKKAIENSSGDGGKKEVLQKFLKLKDICEGWLMTIKAEEALERKEPG